jgi:hypothetical protein
MSKYSAVFDHVFPHACHAVPARHHRSEIFLSHGKASVKGTVACMSHVDEISVLNNTEVYGNSSVKNSRLNNVDVYKSNLTDIANCPDSDTYELRSAIKDSTVHATSIKGLMNIWNSTVTAPTLTGFCVIHNAHLSNSITYGCQIHGPSDLLEIGHNIIYKTLDGWTCRVDFVEVNLTGQESLDEMKSTIVQKIQLREEKENKEFGYHSISVEENLIQEERQAKRNAWKLAYSIVYIEAFYNHMRNR